MKILFLYNNDCAVELFEWLREQGHDIVTYKERVYEMWCRNQQFDLAVSYTYKYILSQEILDALGNNAVNIHNSFLPWNRGADPNMWSIIDGTPRGVTLHYMDTGLDSGDIIAQELVTLEADETLKSSYDKLDQAAKRLFKSAFLYYPFWDGMCKPAKGRGTFHSIKDGEDIRGLAGNYDINVCQFKHAARKLLGLDSNR